MTIINNNETEATYNIQLPPGLQDSSLPIVQGAIEAGKSGDLNAAVNGVAAAIDVATALGIELYPEKGLGGEIPQA